MRKAYQSHRVELRSVNGGMVVGKKGHDAEFGSARIGLSENQTLWSNFEGDESEEGREGLVLDW